jgi:hypothetical protein
MNEIVDTIFRLSIDEISTFKFPKDELFGLRIIEKDVKYEFLIRLSSTNENLLCLGSSGGVNHKTRKIPNFSRHTWQKNFDSSVIYYNDPTHYIDEEIRAGWYLGTKDTWYLSVIAKIMEKIMENSNIKPENTLFYGTSVGGTVSVQLATLIKKSTALAGNFQSFINHFGGSYKFITEYCFKGMSEEEMLDKYDYRFNILKLFEKEQYIPPIIYFVNSYSKKDLKDQCLPFIEGLYKLDYFNNDIEIIMYSNKKGHISRVGLEEALPLVSLILERKIYKYYDTGYLLKKENERLKKENKDLKKLIKKSNTMKITKLLDKFKK